MTCAPICTPFDLLVAFALVAELAAYLGLGWYRRATRPRASPGDRSYVYW